MARPSATGSLVSLPLSLSSSSKQSPAVYGPSSSGTSTTTTEEEGLLVEEDDCALCRNYTEEDGLMLQCAACRSQGHPSCLQMSDALANACRAYDCKSTSLLFISINSH